MTARNDVTEEVTLLVSWALRICLQDLEEDDFAQRLLRSGHPSENDLLRPTACALPQPNGLRVGLIVQPYVWGLALSMVDICYRRRESIDRLCADEGSITSLEVTGVAEAIEQEAAALVEWAADFLASSRGVPALYGACEMCATSGVKCRIFASTPHRPELCICVHGASHHACLEAPGRHSRTPPRTFVSTRWDSAATELLRLCAAFLSSVGHEGIRDLLGLKRTAGSIEGSLPPPHRTLLEALGKPHTLADRTSKGKGPDALPALSAGKRPLRYEMSSTPSEGSLKRKSSAAAGSKLTVGGRALCKHAVRVEDGWWGDAGGTEADKNDRAEKAVLRVLAGATWVNLHRFGGGGEDGVFEVRERSGYGARWSTDGAVFRGFLEPHMEDGHDRGWRH